MKQILVGFHAVQARLRVDPDSLKSVYFDSGRRDRRMGDFLKQAEDILGERLHAADAERLHKLTGHDRHQGVVALAEKMTMARTITEVVEDVEEAKEKPLFLVLDGVTDPHNFGACLRVADGAGVNAVIVPKDRSASINATVSKAELAVSQIDAGDFVAVGTMADHAVGAEQARSVIHVRLRKGVLCRSERGENKRGTGKCTEFHAGS